MRILITNPNTTEGMTATIVKAARRYAASGTEIVGLTAPWGASGIEGYFDGFLSAVAVFEAVSRYRDPYDAIVMAGFGEPGREGLREVVEVPVFDMTECAALMASSLGHRFSVVTTLRRAVPAIEARLSEVGLRTRCASIRSTGLSVSELERDPEETRRRLATEAARAIDEDGAEVILLGCAGMAGFDKTLEEEVGAPVIDGVVAAVKLAEASIAYGVSTSRINSYQRAREEALRSAPWRAGGV